MISESSSSVSEPLPVAMACRADLKVHEIDEEALIYDPVTADTHRLNQTAYFIWRKFQSGTSLDEIARQLAEAYDIGQLEAESHVERLTREFQGRNLLALSANSVGA